MINFDYNGIESLKNLLSNIPTHDAVFKSIEYFKNEKKVAIDLYNPIEETNLSIVFEEVILFLSLESEEWGQNRTISILTLESDFSLIKCLTKKSKLDYDKLICLTFQMFSGSEIYLLCEKVLFNFD